ncbi:UPF0001 protein YggS [hydrothermal vent metagenome]|uniref:UPF0001 protein YggS n=1 Tax=hydrothermal vent metagenome TaxID=652676 RepID=A0A3B1B8L1_9ZZZZ
MTRNTIQNRINNVLSRIRDAENQFNREQNSVKLLVVSKTQTITAIEQAIAMGLSSFGESYLQDALPKIEHFAGLDKHQAIDWHFIGPIQSNKTAKIAQHFNWVHSVDRLSIAERLNKQRPNTLSKLNICIQVNIDNATQKSGIAAKDVLQFAQQTRMLPNLELRGLMAVPKPSSKFSEQRQAFRALFKLYETLKQHDFALDTLSMGMSSDLTAAIAEGSTLVRIGTDIFGLRL